MRGEIELAGDSTVDEEKIQNCKNRHKRAGDLRIFNIPPPRGEILWVF